MPADDTNAGGAGGGAGVPGVSRSASSSAVSFLVYSREGCAWCERAKALLDARGLAYREVREAAGLGLARTLPLVVDVREATEPTLRHGTVVGGHDDLVDLLDEPVLRRSQDRFSVFPIRHADMWDLYKRAVASFWTAEEISMARDVSDFARLTPDERHFVKHVLAFFASSDGIVMENLAANFAVEVQVPEARAFYAYQSFNEAVHAETYGLMIDALVADHDERTALFGAIATNEAVARKAAWALKWLSRDRRFAARLLAFVCVEGILFSGSFCAIFWLKQRGLMPGLALSNEFISRDEALHQEFGQLLYSSLADRLDQQSAHDIVREAVDAEKHFITRALPCSLLGMNADLMATYVEFVADRLLAGLGYAPAFGAANPFPWMELQSLAGKSNFFERFPSDYRKAGLALSSKDDQAFGLDAEF